MQRQKLTIHDRQYRGSGLQRQNLTINFDQKSRTQATFTYKQGEIDKNGIEVELTNVDVVNATGQVRVKDPEGNFLEPGMVTVIGSKANFILPTYTPGTWEFELRIFNDNGTTISSTYAYTVMESFNTDDTTVEVYESLWDTWTKEFVSWSDAERTREANESGRIIEHSERIETVDKAINDAKSATVSATVATQATLDAIDNATHATQATLDAIDDAAQATQATLDAIDDAAQATSNAQKATSDANSATTKATEATVKANTATTTANQATVNANKATADANSATQSVNNAIAAGTVDLEPKQARTDFNGVEHDTLKTRLDNDYETLASLIPTDIAFDGYESVTTNDTLSGDVKGAVATGQTLVNLAKKGDVESEGNESSYPTIATNYLPELKAGLTLTVFVDVENLGSNTSSFVILSTTNTNQIFNTPKLNGKMIFKCVYTRTENIGSISRLAMRTGNVEKVTWKNIIILEGDHTDKPLEFFEGLKSAEVSEVTSHGVNLVSSEQMSSEFVKGRHFQPTYGNDLVNFVGDEIIFTGNNSSYGAKLFRLPKANTRYRLEYKAVFDSGNVVCWFGSGVSQSTSRSVETTTGADGVVDSFGFGVYSMTTGSAKITDIRIYEVTPNTPTEYVPYQSSKTTLSEPIILRSLPNGVADTYDVDTGVLTRRCGEVVLNGSESWGVHTSGDSYIAFSCTNALPVNSIIAPAQSDNFPLLSATGTNEGINTWTNKTLYVSIAKSKLATPDIAGFKAWLAQNPTTVVYQLAESTTEYIENNGQLRSYDYQTTVSADSIVPVKLNGNIPVNYASTLNTLSTVARELKLENLSLIEQAESLSEQLITANETNDYQDSLIDVSLLATDELYTLIEPLLPELFSNTKGGNAMVDAYVAMVIKGLKTIDQVPSRYREEVKRVLAELEK